MSNDPSMPAPPLAMQPPARVEIQFPQGVDWPLVTNLLSNDPSGRGFVQIANSYLNSRSPASAPIQAAVAGFLARPVNRVAIVSGFAIPTANGWVPETDGPPGALALAQVLAELGIHVDIITDTLCQSAFTAGLPTSAQSLMRVLCLPFEAEDEQAVCRQFNWTSLNRVSDAWIHQYLDETDTFANGSTPLSHLISVERAGPNHHAGTVSHAIAGTPAGAAPCTSEDFCRRVTPCERNVCRNARGISINARTAKTHRLFEICARERPAVVTTGVADGGNEIGCGAIPWPLLAQFSASSAVNELAHQLPEIACRVPVQHLLPAGISNWGAYAIAMGLWRAHQAVAANGPRGFPITAAWLQELVQGLVSQRIAVDGLTGEFSASVDGLELGKYLGHFTQLQAAYGLT